LKSTETHDGSDRPSRTRNFSNFGSLKSTETDSASGTILLIPRFQQFRLVEEH